MELMDEAWSYTSVTAANTYAIVGLFGYERSNSDDCPWGSCEDEYYFWMKFVPFENITAVVSSAFRIWFQIGQSTSDWHGVEYVNTGGNLVLDSDLSPVSSTNNNFASNQNEDNDSEFRGKIYVENGLYEVVIWRFIPRWEQDTTDGSIDRIEKGRVLTAEYDGAITTSLT